MANLSIRSRHEVTVECQIIVPASPAASVDADVGQVRPWTGAEIREAEPLIFVLLALLVCGLLVRMVYVAKAGGIGLHGFWQAYRQHYFGIIDSSGTETRRSVAPQRLGAPSDLDRNQHPAIDSATLSTPRAPAFVFNGSSAVETPMVTESAATRVDASENPLHAMDSSVREEVDL